MTAADPRGRASLEKVLEETRELGAALDRASHLPALESAPPPRDRARAVDPRAVRGVLGVVVVGVAVAAVVTLREPSDEAQQRAADARITALEASRDAAFPRYVGALAELARGGDSPTLRRAARTALSTELRRACAAAAAGDRAACARCEATLTAFPEGVDGAAQAALRASMSASCGR